MRLKTLNSESLYGAIYVDAPWAYRVWDKDTGMGRSAESHYKTMSQWELIRLGPTLSGMAAKDCALFYWTSGPMLPEALEIINLWGFKYSTVAFAWFKLTKHLKPHFGMGYATRAGAEFCVLATRGNPRRLHADVRQAEWFPVGEHSEKPTAYYSRIERLYPGPYLELFGRRHYPGWDVYGNEAPDEPEPIEAFDTLATHYAPLYS